MTHLIALVTVSDIQPIIDLVTNAVTSDHTRRSYGRALNDCINQRLTAIRKLANEAANNGIIDHSTAQAIGRVEGVRREGKRLGNWLTKKQAQRLLKLPDVSTSRKFGIVLSWPPWWAADCVARNVPA